MDKTFFEALRGVSLNDLDGGLLISCVCCLGPGEASGEREGNDSRVLAEVGVTRDRFLDLDRMVPDFREAVER